MEGKVCKFLRVEQIPNNEVSGGRFEKPPVRVKICSLKPHKSRCGCDHVDNMEACSNFQEKK
jgi:hypothetical protein